ncbi:hypothetical protein [Cellvibrio mixtus]|uniref:hypothetical protein n=1 Tax=Cellvibrio mixtus TaxID=39650 RepID=UPI000586835F|nr:hypothetical protein [Cellvibrio mixtus]
MSIHDPGQKSSGANISSEDIPDKPGDLEKTLLLGEQILGLVNDVVDLARMEALLAIKSAPKVLMLWFLMMPIILLTWCSFSAWVAWMLYSINEQPGVGLFAFFLQQLLLLIVCRWFYAKNRLRMTLPYTRAHIDKFMKGFADGSGRSSEAKK